jgi:TolB-like protein
MGGYTSVMISTALMLALTVAASPIKVAVTRLNLVDSSDSRADFYTDHLADRLAEQGLAVTSPREVSAMLGHERQRQLSGCADESNCLAEIADALGVEGLVLGHIAKVGQGFQVNLKIIGAQNGKRLGTFSAKVGDEQEVVATLTRAAAELAQQAGQALGRPVEVKVMTTPGARRWWWIPGIIAVGGIVTAAIELPSAESMRLELTTGRFDSSTSLTKLQQGQSARLIGWIGAGVAAASLVTMAAMLIFGGDQPAVTPVALWSPGMTGFALVGVFP